MKAFTHAPCSNIAELDRSVNVTQESLPILKDLSKHSHIRISQLRKLLTFYHAPSVISSQIVRSNTKAPLTHSSLIQERTTKPICIINSPLTIMKPWNPLTTVSSSLLGIVSSACPKHAFYLSYLERSHPSVGVDCLR